jgi:hypothetical protein
MQTSLKGDIDQDIRRGHRAAELLADPILAGAFQELDAEILQAWRKSANPDEREALHHRMIALAAVKSKLEVLVGRGEWAENDVKLAARREKFGVNL